MQSFDYKNSSYLSVMIKQYRQEIQSIENKPHYISDRRCLTSATPECNVRSETSVTVPSRLNAPIVLWRLNNLTLPARVGLTLSTWRLESIAGLKCSGFAQPRPCIGWFRDPGTVANEESARNLGFLAWLRVQYELMCYPTCKSAFYYNHNIRRLKT